MIELNDILVKIKNDEELKGIIKNLDRRLKLIESCLFGYNKNIEDCKYDSLD